MHLRYLPGVEDDMVETEQTQEDKMGKAVTVEDETKNDDIITLHPEFLDDLADIIATLTIRRMSQDLLEAEERFVYEEIFDSITHAFEISDFSRDSFDSWFEINEGLGRFE